MALSSTDLQQLRDDAVRNKSAGIVNIHFSDGRAIQYVSTVEDWRKIIADLDEAIAAASGTKPVRFTLPTYSRD